MGAKYSRGKSIDHADNYEKEKGGNDLSFRRLSLFGSTRTAPEKAAPQLSERQKELLVSSFADLKNSIAQIGVLLFLGLFESHPEMQGFFGDLKSCPPELLPESKKLRQHALRVMGFVEKCISRIREPERLDGLIRQLGRHHVRYGAPPAYIALVGPQFISAIRMSVDQRWDAETEDAWLSLFAVVTFVMKQAMASASNPELVTPTA